MTVQYGFGQHRTGFMEQRRIKIILAPLQGFTDATFRDVFANHFKGVDGAIAPFIPTMGNRKIRPGRLRDVSPEKNTRMTVTPQILGSNADDFIFLARHLHDMGHGKINWNLGCPFAKVANKRRGSGLLPYPEMVDAFLDLVLPKISGSLSIKIRLGRHSKDEIQELLPVFDKYPISEIILHPRTGIQMYDGLPDHDAFEKARCSSWHSFVYNGDIKDLFSFDQAMNKFQDLSHFMIGRGLLSNPFLAEIIKGVHPDGNKIHRLKYFHDDLFAAYERLYSGPAHLIGRMKGFWSYLGPGFKGKEKSLKRILKTQSVQKYKELANTFFCGDTEFLS